MTATNFRLITLVYRWLLSLAVLSLSMGAVAADQALANAIKAIDVSAQTGDKVLVKFHWQTRLRCRPALRSITHRESRWISPIRPMEPERPTSISSAGGALRRSTWLKSLAVPGGAQHGACRNL